MLETRNKKQETRNQKSYSKKSEAPFSLSMASFIPFSIKFTPLTLILLLTCLSEVNGVPEPEFEAMLSALRSKGYNLFGNAIVTSDIRYEVLSGTSFTFFAPTDGALFSLDMTAPASLYVSTLRYHVAYKRFITSDLQSLRSGSTLPTLLSKHQVLIGVVKSTESDVITVDGIDVVIPGLYKSDNIVVHGLNGILNYRSSVNRENLARMSSPVDVSSGIEPDLDGIVPESNGDLSLQPEFQPPVLDSPSPKFGNPPNPSTTPFCDSFLCRAKTPAPETEFGGYAQSEAPAPETELGGYAQSEAPAPGTELGGYAQSDMGADYGGMQPGYNVTGQCDEKSNCVEATEGASPMEDEGIPAMAPDFLLDGKTTDGNDL